MGVSPMCDGVLAAASPPNPLQRLHKLIRALTPNLPYHPHPMCGIAGIVSFTPDYRPSPEELTRMSTCIAHRGPDGEGTLFATAQGGGGATAAFAHRRLAILDPDPRSNQPFSATYQGRTAHLIYNGEIYNYRQLRPELEKLLPNFPWRTTGDTEVLLAAYFAWGANCVDHLLGMFAFAIFDESNGSLLLARDRLGQKPLYLAEHQGKVAFASELSAIAALSWPNKITHPEALTHYFSVGYIPAPLTIYAGIQKLPPATTRHYTPSPKDTTYYKPNKPNPTPPADPVTATRIAVESAVATQLVSDVPLGCFLSGGIDSSITTLCAQRALRANGVGTLNTFTARFDDPRYDESPYAAEVAAHLGTKHLSFTVYPKASEDLPLLAKRYGEPFADSSALPSYYLSRETRNHVKVALSGDGGDELFAGYDRYRAMRLAERIRPLAWALPPLPTRGHPKSKVTRVARFLNSAHLAAAQRYESLMRLFPAGTFTTPALSGIIAGHAFPPGDLVEAAMQLDRLTYLPDDLLTKLDRASMAHALEVRCPFMDHHLVNLAASIPAKTHLAHGKKSLLKQAFGNDLPKSVFSRPKSGFAVPIGDWFRGPLRELLTNTLLATNAFNSTILPRESIETMLLQHQHGGVGGTDHTQRLYALLMLELWHQSRP